MMSEKNEPSLERMIEDRKNKALRDMDARTPEQTYLEIGTGGIVAGYDPRRFADSDLVVTVDLVEGAGASASQQLPDNLHQTYNQLNKRFKDEPLPDYVHDSVIGDGRDLEFFGERKFSKVLMCNLACDPGISQEDFTKLLNESLRVLTDNGQLLLSEELTRFIAEERFEKTNFAEAGVKLERADLRERAAVHHGPLFIPTIYKLTKTEKWGEVPLRCYEDIDWAYYQLRKETAERKAAREENKQARKRARKDKLAKSVVGRMFKKN